MLNNAQGFPAVDVYDHAAPDDLPQGEPIVIQHDGTEIVKYPDGSHEFREIQPEQQPQVNADDHDQNLAVGVLSYDELRELGYSLKNSIEMDAEGQEQNNQAISEAIDLLGLDPTYEVPENDAPFKGSSSVTSPAFFLSALDLVTTIKKELFKKDMVDSQILGDATDELRDVAYREKAFFNYYFNTVSKEYKKESVNAAFWAIIVGVAYKKVYIDPILGRPTSKYIQPQDFIINRQYACHYSATRKTHVIHLTEKELEVRKLMGIYKDIDVMPENDSSGNGQPILEQLNLIASYTPNQNNLDDPIYDIYECHVDLKIKGDPAAGGFDIPLPYIVSLDAQTGDILRIQRNWKKEDPLRTKKEFFVAYSLLPALMGEGYGLMHSAGNSAKAATALTRQLINTATFANFPGGVYQAGVRIQNNNLRPAPGEFVPIFTAGPISEAIQPLPYKEPSPTLHTLKNELEDSIKQPSAIINDKIDSFNSQAPVGSTLAMLESLQKIPNAILQSFHEALTEELALFKDRFAEWLPADTPYPFKVPGGEHVVIRDDFVQSTAVIPSADPSVQNSTYRFLQSEIILNNVRQDPDIHDKRFVYEYFYKNLGLGEEDIQKILPQPPGEPQVPPLDPISENQNIMTGKPVKAGVWQDHQAHMTTHSLLINDPNTAPAAQAHIQEHQALQFLVEMQQQMGFEMPEDPSQIPHEQQNQIAIAAAEVAKQKLEEQQQAQQPQQPMMDPAMVMLEDVKVKAQKNELDAELQKIKLEIDQLKNDSTKEIAMKKLEIDHLKLELERLRLEKDTV